MLDVEMGRIADHPLGDLRRQQRPERSVLIDGDLVAEGQQARGDQHRNHRRFHPDRRRHQCRVDLSKVDAAVRGAPELRFEEVPRRLKGLVGRAAEAHRPVPVAAVESGTRQERPIHGRLRTVPVETEIGIVLLAPLDHRLEQQAPSLRSLRGEFAAVEHLVADARSERIGEVRSRGKRRAASPGREFNGTVARAVASVGTCAVARVVVSASLGDCVNAALVVRAVGLASRPIGRADYAVRVVGVVRAGSVAVARGRVGWVGLAVQASDCFGLVGQEHPTATLRAERLGQSVLKVDPDLCELFANFTKRHPVPCHARVIENRHHRGQLAGGCVEPSNIVGNSRDDGFAAGSPSWCRGGGCRVGRADIDDRLGGGS